MTSVHIGFPSHAVSGVHMRDWGALAASVEQAGFDALWHSNERFFRDMFVRMTVSACHTERITLGGAVADGFAVHPALTAQSLATVAELAEGRVTLALGAGGSGLPMMGITRTAVAETIRGTYLSIAELLAGQTVSRTTQTFELRNAHLRVRLEEPVPLWIATRGPRTLQMAGAIADGVIIASQASRRGLEASLARVGRGAAAAGRSGRDVRTMARVDTCVHDDAGLALEGCRLMVAKLLWMSYPDRGFVHDAGLTVPEELERVIATRDYDALEAAYHLVPDDLIETLCWTGTPDQVAERVANLVAATGVTDVGFWLLPAPGQTLAEAIDLLAAALPRLRS